MRGRHLGAGLAFLATILVSGCGPGDAGSPSTSTPTTPSTAPSPSGSGGIIVTFEVNEGERFRVLLTDRLDQAAATRLLAGEEGPDIPNGRIVRQTGVNEGWSWSLDPADFEFSDLTTEVCDGDPSDVESGDLTGDRYCPWSAVVVEIEPAP
jgi:hypothetical protein